MLLARGSGHQILFLLWMFHLIDLGHPDSAILLIAYLYPFLHLNYDLNLD